MPASGTKVEVVECVRLPSPLGGEGGSTVAIVDRPGCEEAARYRVLCHRLRQGGTPRTLVVASPGREEGKTTCATNLAIALAEDGSHKVLLIDTHLRAPRLGTLLGLSGTACFHAQLCRRRDGARNDWQVVEVQSDHVAQGRLHVLPIAARNRPEDGVLGWLPVVAAIEELRRSDYDAVVIDAAPVLGNADVNLVVGASDGYILTAWAHKTLGTSLIQATEQLGRDKLLGVVLLGT